MLFGVWSNNNSPSEHQTRYFHEWRSHEWKYRRLMFTSELLFDHTPKNTIILFISCFYSGFYHCMWISIKAFPRREPHFPIGSAFMTSRRWRHCYDWQLQSLSNARIKQKTTNINWKNYPIMHYIYHIFSLVSFQLALKCRSRVLAFRKSLGLRTCFKV